MICGKSSEATKPDKDINERAEKSDLYIKQLHEFLSKSSDAPSKFSSGDKHNKLQLSNSADSKSQPTDLKHKCRRAVYRFMKGLFDERKLKNIHSVSQAEPIYFEVNEFF